MKRFKVIASLVIVSLWCQSLVSHSQTLAANAPVSTPELRSESQLRTEASLYDAAIREISKGTTIRLDSPDDLKAAIALLSKQIPNLKYNRSKLVVLGLSDSTFVNSVKERIKDKNSTDAFAKELSTDPNSVLKLNGASSLQSRLAQSIQTDVTLLRTVAARLKKSAADLKAKIHADHASRRTTFTANRSLGATDAIANLLSPRDSGASAITTVMVFVTLFYTPGAFTLLSAIVILASGPLSLIGAAFILGKLIENVGTDKGRDRLAQCEDQANQTYEQCKTDADKQCCGLSVIYEADCLSDWLINSGICLIS